MEKRLARYEKALREISWHAKSGVEVDVAVERLVRESLDRGDLWEMIEQIGAIALAALQEEENDRTDA